MLRLMGGGAVAYSSAEQPVQNSSFEVVTLSSESAKAASYDNHSIATVNDHDVRISTMTEAYHWHCHPDSDETFLALEEDIDYAIEIIARKPSSWRIDVAIDFLQNAFHCCVNFALI